MPKKKDMRPFEAIEHHYREEVALAKKLMSSDKEARGMLYGEVYDELFERVPDHPQLTNMDTKRAQSGNKGVLLPLILDSTSREDRLLEIGAGDCSLSVKLCEYVAHCTAIDVSQEIASGLQGVPENFEFRLTDGTSMPVPDGSIDFAISHQLMEHLHPDDALEQLNNILKALRKGGKYLCITPNRISGPHDVSVHFDSEAAGLHLKEYKYSELVRIFKDAGFTSVKVALPFSSRFIFYVHPSLLYLFELLIGSLSRKTILRLAQYRAISGILGIKVLAEK